MLAATADIIRADMPEQFHEGWNRITGVSVEGNTLTIDPDAYFFRYERGPWTVCDWDGVRANLLNTRETADVAVEQLALDYAKAHGRPTEDPTEVLGVAWSVYSYLFRPEQLQFPDVQELGVTAEHLRMLTEMGTMMALNRVDLDGHISSVGPAWMFPEASKVVYELDHPEAQKLDELYHGTWFNEPRRIESVLAHAALGGRLVHGCQSKANMAGGCTVPYGTDMAAFRENLGGMRVEWIDRVRACAK